MKNFKKLILLAALVASTSIVTPMFKQFQALAVKCSQTVGLQAAHAKIQATCAALSRDIADIKTIVAEIRGHKKTLTDFEKLKEEANMWTRMVEYELESTEYCKVVLEFPEGEKVHRAIADRYFRYAADCRTEAETLKSKTLK